MYGDAYVSQEGFAHKSPYGAERKPPDSGPEPKCLRLGRTPANQGILPASDLVHVSGCLASLLPARMHQQRKSKNITNIHICMAMFGTFT